MARTLEILLLAIRVSARHASARRSQGTSNASSVAALINSGWLLVLEVLVAAAAIDRLISGTPHVDGLPVLVVSGIAALVMAGGVFILREDGDDATDEAAERNLSVAAVLLDTIAAAAAGAAAAGAVILASGGWYWLDPAVALAIAVVVTYHAFALIRKAVTRRGARRPKAEPGGSP